MRERRTAVRKSFNMATNQTNQRVHRIKKLKEKRIQKDENPRVI